MNFQKFFIIVLITVLVGCDEPVRAESDFTGVLVTTNLDVFTYENGSIKKTGSLPTTPANDSDPFATTARGVYQGNHTTYISLRNRGMYQSNDTKSWHKTADFTSQNALYDSDAIREITSFDPVSGFFTYKHDLMRLKDGKPVAVENDISQHVYLSALAVQHDKIYIGTTTNGLYAATLSKDKKLVFKRDNTGLPYTPHDRGFYMYEEISAIKFAPDGTLWVGTSIQGGVFKRSPKDKAFQRVTTPFSATETFDTYDFAFYENNKVLVTTNKGLLTGNLTALTKLQPWGDVLPGLKDNVTGALLCTKQSHPTCAFTRFNNVKISKEKQKRMKTADGRKLLYSSAFNYKRKGKQLQELLKSGFWDGMVLDMKDDNGYVRYDTQVEFIRSLGAVRPLVNLREIIQFMKANNLYLSIRLVVFKDAVLFKKPGFAILNRKTKQPWVGVPGERWVDPYNFDLAEKYYGPLVKELTELGVDEIQLDYIRFPSDGAIQNCYFSHKKGEMYNTEALANFLWQIRQATDLPLMTDIYGYHGLYRAAGVIGQDIDVFGQFADVIAPMLYSSHFGNLYMSQGPRKKRAYNLLAHSALRYNHLAAGHFLVRPWLQAFPMKTGIWGYGKDYFAAQVKAGQDNGVNGYMFWGSFEHIKAVTKALYHE